MMQVPPERAILCILDIPTQVALDNRRLWNLMVTDQQGLLDVVAAALGDTVPEDVQGSEAPLTQGQLSAMSAFRASGQGGIPAGGLLTFLTKKQLRPLPEHRRDVLGSMVELVRPGMSGEELVDAIEPKFPALSKGKLRGIVQAAMRGGGLLGEDGAPVRTLKMPISRVLDTVDQLEECCIRAYAAAIMFTDPNWFVTNAHYVEFREVVGAAPPPPNQLAQIHESVLSRRAASGQGE
jgi:hypothetical protein